MDDCIDPTLERDPVGMLLWAYRHGIFPMADSAEPEAPLAWLYPQVRGVLPLRESDGFHVPRRLMDLVRRRPFLLTSDVCFSEVMRQCARPRPTEQQTWIDDRLVRAYSALHAAGHAHSIEAWAAHGSEGDVGSAADPDRVVRTIDGRSMVLVGGIYGVQIGAAFMAESKFHRADLGGSGASKVCLVALARHLDARGFLICDTQFSNEHIAQFGVHEIPRAEYLALLTRAVEAPASWAPFDPEVALKGAIRA